METFEDFKNDLGERESSNDYHCKNAWGFLGRWQFGKPRLWDLGLSIDNWKPSWWNLKKRLAHKVHMISEIEFLLNSDLQDTIFRAHIKDLRKRISKKYSKYYGIETHDIWDTTASKLLPHNIILTESGLVAGAHLEGLGGVSDYVRKAIDNKDGLNTPISEYIKMFADYDLSII